ncbi:unnamed protein product [Chironomus riparius]|uniref:Potassium channel domain-containing protein n=1 Tax=Chironomus riparius TaxID=315576 RepID=A0A9N9S2K4_9DIPT|nr:unnamed protein product [Chironomus riparius]
MERKRSVRRRQKAPFERLKDHCRAFTAFMFSNVGITFLVVFYIIAGSLLFEKIEEVSHEQYQEQTNIDRTNAAMELWKISCCTQSTFDRASYEAAVEEKLILFQNQVTERQRKGVPDGKWTFSSGFLYSLTVITTIGYGNKTPTTELGKITTIFYAIIGMPLFLLYLSNIGDILAKSFKWIYAKCCLCRIFPNIARRRLAREKHKERLRQSIGEFPSDSGSIATSITSCENDSDIENKIQEDPQAITVPITVCVAIMIGYIFLGAVLFKAWEDWNYLDGSYFCFISLSSIGFGDLVPGAALSADGYQSVDLAFIFCAVYLLLGMALIAMCFNLMQEQVIHKLTNLKNCASQCFKCKR